MKYNPDTFSSDCKVLAERIGDYAFTHILSVERGGGYVVRELARYLKKSITVVPIRVSLYDGQTRRLVPHIEYPNMKVFKDTEKVLIVDDLLDSGETIKIVKNCFVLRKAGDVKVAVLLKKPTSCIEPDFCVRHNVTSWVQFHWEDEHGHHNTVCDTPHSAS